MNLTLSANSNGVDWDKEMTLESFITDTEGIEHDCIVKFDYHPYEADDRWSGYRGVDSSVTINSITVGGIGGITISAVDMDGLIDEALAMVEDRD